MLRRTRNNTKALSKGNSIVECSVNPENLKLSIRKVKKERNVQRFALNKYLDSVRNNIPIDFLYKCSIECRPKNGVKTYISRSTIAYSAWKYIEHLKDRLTNLEESK